jgi:sensor histidine kinase YesM
MKKFWGYLGYTFFLPVLPAILIYFLFPINFDRFSFEKSSYSLSENYFIWYDDLTGDGSSNKIIIHDKDHFVAVTVYNHDEVLYNQWNFRGNMRFLWLEQPLITGDFNNDGFKELYVFTLSNDSIFLHIIGDLTNVLPLMQDRFITKVGPGRGAIDPVLLTPEMTDLDGNGQKELLFGLGSGFSIFPRNVFAYFVEQDSLIQSPASSASINSITIEDIDGDQKPEILLGTHSPANVPTDQVEFHDHSNWMMVLDTDLNFVFPPMEIPGNANTYAPFVFKKDNVRTLAGLYFTAFGGGITKLFFYDLAGNNIETHSFPISASSALVTLDENNETLIALTKSSLGTNVYNNDFVLVQNFPDIYLSSRYVRSDVKGNSFLLILDYMLGKIHAFPPNLQSPSSFDIELSSGHRAWMCVIQSVNNEKKISIQTGPRQYILEVSLNPMYYFKYIYPFILYVGFLVFVLITRKIQRNQILKQQKIEKKITELQLSLVKNQLDPHFTLNVLNAIIHSFKKEQTVYASDMLMHFARMNKTMLMSAQSIQRSLGKEIEFCIDYLELEKLRLNDKFHYLIHIDQDVDREMQVPKMIMQIYIENAVKHGISYRQDGGLISLTIKTANQGIDITITDNGPGRTNPSHNLHLIPSNGKGMTIMEEYYSLYFKYFNTKVAAEITDLYDDQGNGAGTQVRIKYSTSDDKKNQLTYRAN